MMFSVKLAVSPTPSAFFNFTENSLYVFDTFIIKSLSLTVKRN